MEEKKERFLDGIIRELCEEMDIKLEKLSNDWILQLSKDGKIRHITRNHFDINPHSSNEGIWSTVEEEFSKHKCLVVKPNQGYEGEGIELCHTKKEVEKAIEKLFQTCLSISICPYYHIETEYRTFYLKGEVHLIYGKNKPIVIGDGQATMEELLTNMNFPNRKAARDNLSALDMTYVPEKGERVEISWKHNLSGGSIPEVLEKGELYDKIKNLSIRAGKALNMNFATIDIIQTVEGKLYVMEANAGICAELFTKVVEGSYGTVKEIYRKALIDMFNT